ncbi:hypothetical protein [Haloprofundus salilacus]|nr:hypothetical protein [Haloprofundus salilacus]
MFDARSLSYSGDSRGCDRIGDRALDGGLTTAQVTNARPSYVFA